MRSKALKPGNRWDRDEETATFRQRVYYWFLDSKLSKVYYEPITFYRRLKRAYYWVKNCIWTNWDFDALTIYPLLEYKLKRVQYCLENGHAVQNPKDMKALRILIKLANRLANDYHETKLYDKHEARWGSLNTWLTDCNDGTGNSQMHFNRPKANTPELEEQERNEFRVMFQEHEPKWRERDEKLFFEILRRHVRYLWD